jgi:hypothetical protein
VGLVEVALAVEVKHKLPQIREMREIIWEIHFWRMSIIVVLG